MYPKLIGGACVAIALSAAWTTSPQAMGRNVTVQNTPLPVVEAAPIEPINACAEARLGNPNNVLFMVPADSILVIEHASLNTGILDDQEAVSASIRTIVGNIESQHFVGIVSAPPRLGGAATPMQVYADPGTDVTVQRGSMVPAGAEPVDAEVCIAGRLLPLLP
jgi:hypothetical protein